MKKYLMTGVAALTLCAGFTSCSHDDFEPMTQAQIDKAKYDMAFLNYVGGKIASNQDWGFGATRGLTRAAGTWTLNHSDDWMSYLEFTAPTDYIEVKEGVQLEGSGTYYVPDTFTGTLSFKDNFAGKIYIDTDLTGFTGNNLGNVSVYILENGSWTLEGISTGNITIYNNGTLTLGSWAWQNQNIKTVYNGGNIKIGKEGEYPGFADGVSLYSNSTGLVELYGTETDLKLNCDIHGTMKVYGNLKIQNGKEQYICGLEVSGTLDMTQGTLRTSYVEATDIKFDGAHIWLLPQGHIVAKNQISMPNSASEIYGYEGSYALVETKNFYLRNHNNFADTFSSNISFKVTGTIDIQERVTRENGQVDDVSNQYTVAEYVVSQNGKAVADRFNGEEISGNPECGAAYGNPTTTPEPETPTTPTPEPTEEYDLRIIAEDLSAQEAGDFDFNDVVFDVKFDASNAKIKILAAGGTLPLRIDGKHEVHAALNAGENEMVNTNANGGVERDPVEIELGYGVADAAAAKDITIEVYKNGEWQELTAEKGEPAAKLAVGTDFQWLDERQSIKDNYEKFVDWVNGTGFTSEWWK